MRWIIAIVATLILAGPAFATDYDIAPYAGVPTQYTLQSGGTSVANGHTLNFSGAAATVGCVVAWGSTTTTGAITFETAGSASYTGAWAPLGTVTWGAASSQVSFALSQYGLRAFRARISTASDGNGVTVTCTGQAR